MTGIDLVENLKVLYARILEMRSLTAIHYVAEEFEAEHGVTTSLTDVNDLDEIWLRCCRALGKTERVAELEAWLKKKRSVNPIVSNLGDLA